MRFSPHFSYSHEIVNRLTRITASREVILHAHLVPKWEVSLRREQLVRAAHASTAIEGNPLTLEEVSRLAEGRRVMAGRKAQAEVLNYLKVLGQIDTYQNQGNITIETLLRLPATSQGALWKTLQMKGRSGRSRLWWGTESPGPSCTPHPLPARWSRW
jgi:Fic family protein